MPNSTDKSFQDVEFGEELPDLHPDISLDNVKLFAKSARITPSIRPSRISWVGYTSNSASRA